MNVLDIILDVGKKNQNVKSIVSFGGLGRGEMKNNSDIDLMFVLDELESSSEVHKSLVDIFSDKLEYDCFEKGRKLVLYLTELKLDVMFCTQLSEISKFFVCSEMKVEHVPKCIVYSRHQNIEQSTEHELKKILTERKYPEEYSPSHLISRCVEFSRLILVALGRKDLYECEFLLGPCMKTDLVRLELISKGVTKYLYKPKMAYDSPDLESERIGLFRRDSCLKEVELTFRIFMKMIHFFEKENERMNNFVEKTFSECMEKCKTLANEE